MPFTVKDLLTSWGVEGLKKPVRKAWKTVSSCVCWVIWKEKMLDASKGKPVPKIKFKCLTAYGFWLLVQLTR